MHVRAMATRNIYIVVSLSSSLSRTPDSEIIASTLRLL